MYEFDAGSVVFLRTLASVAVPIRAEFSIMYTNGRFGNVGLELTTDADRETIVSATSPELARPGKVAGVFVRNLTNAKRGQIWVQCRIGHISAAARLQPLCAGYVRTERYLGLGIFEEPGPGGGEGFRSAVPMATNVAGNVNTTFSPEATNAFRRIHGIVLYYNRGGAAGSITPNIQISRPYAGALPTGFAGTGLVWQITGPVLAVNEEGSIWMDSKSGSAFASLNTNGTLSAATAVNFNQNPFPLDVLEADTTEINMLIGGGLAADVYSAFADIEEWLDP